MKKYKKDDRVVLFETSNLETHNEYEDDDTTRGVVLSVDNKGRVFVKWDGPYRTPNPSYHMPSELILEAKADQILSKLEDEYEVWAAPIRKKIEKAAKLLLEANEMAGEQGRELVEMENLNSALIDAMDKAGWQTSSFGC